LQLEELSRLALAPGEWRRSIGHDGLPRSDPMEGVRDAIDSLSDLKRRARFAVWSTFTAAPATEFDGCCAIPLRARIRGSTVARSRYGAETLRDRIELDPKRLHEVEQRCGAQRGAQVSRTSGAADSGFTRMRLKDLEMTADLEPWPCRSRLALALRRLATRLSAERNRRDETRPRGERRNEGLAIRRGSEVELRSLFATAAWGNEQVEFLVRPIRAPSRASLQGDLRGELSESALHPGDYEPAAAVPTLIFDEVDAGIGGRAEVVGKK